MSAVQERRELSFYFEHDTASVGAASSVTFNMGSGTDTDTNRYLNLPEGFAYGVNMIPTVACSITKINGRPLKTAMSIGILGWTEDKCRINSFTVTAGSATVVEVEVKC